MKAILLTSNHAGKMVDIQQWCNDWFSIDGDFGSKIVSPSSLLFTGDTAKIIIDHKNNGMLFNWYRIIVVKPRKWKNIDEDGRLEFFCYSFEKIKHGRLATETK